MVLVKCCGAPQWLARALGSSAMTDGGGQSWLCAHTQLWWPVTAACIMGKTSCRHTYSGGGRACSKGLDQLQW